MKNKFKLLGIIALVAVIGFSMTACDDGSGGGGSSGGGISKQIGGWAKDGSETIVLQIYASTTINGVLQYDEFTLIFYNTDNDNGYSDMTYMEKEGNAFVQMWGGGGTLTTQSDTKITLANFSKTSYGKEVLAQFNGSYTKIAADIGDIKNITVTGVPSSYTDYAIYLSSGTYLYDDDKQPVNGTVIFSPTYHSGFSEGETSSPGFNILRMSCYDEEGDNYNVYYYTNGKGNDGSGYENAEYIFLSGNITIEFSKFKK
jgi:hypothetical protein